MGILENIGLVSINAGVEEFRATPGAVLLDVRTPLQYQRKRVPESLNLPMEELDRIHELVPDKNVPLFIYAHGPETGAKAARQLKAMGYTKARNIGGIKNCCGNKGYQGVTEGDGWDACPLV